MTTPHRVPRKIWILYRVHPDAVDPNAPLPTTAARRRKLRAFATPEGARKAAASDLERRAGDGDSGGDPAEDLRWERWNRRLVSESRNGVAYTIERYDVLEN